MPLFIAGQSEAPKAKKEPNVTLSLRPSSYAGRVMLQATDEDGNVTKLLRIGFVDGRLVFNRRAANPEVVSVDGSGKISEDTSI